MRVRDYLKLDPQGCQILLNNLPLVLEASVVWLVASTSLTWISVCRGQETWIVRYPSPFKLSGYRREDVTS